MTIVIGRFVINRDVRIRRETKSFAEAEAKNCRHAIVVVFIIIKATQLSRSSFYQKVVM